jgi:hypothetical protein
LGRSNGPEGFLLCAPVWHPQQFCQLAHIINIVGAELLKTPAREIVHLLLQHVAPFHLPSCIDWEIFAVCAQRKFVNK